jgi:hypothetical protein
VSWLRFHHPQLRHLAVANTSEERGKVVQVTALSARSDLDHGQDLLRVDLDDLRDRELSGRGP